ncbi:hypothetical protein GCM10009539_02120 [Cryptosporangium japonicum]|uniref:Uncharacterized protein n=1 Tax=Cryptosporangium japonicum TaxID=80872 RepID=A0ABP3D0V5_9ACTN
MAIAIARFATPATTTVSVLSPPDPLSSAGSGPGVGVSVTVTGIAHRCAMQPSGRTGAFLSARYGKESRIVDGGAARRGRVGTLCE